MRGLRRSKAAPSAGSCRLRHPADRVAVRCCAGGDHSGAESEEGAKKMIGIGDKLTAEIRRGPDSWMFIYIALGFALSIEGNILQMIPLRFPYNPFLYVALMTATSWLFICNGWFQNKLIWMKGLYENKAR
jgi:hypothetical protein